MIVERFEGARHEHEARCPQPAQSIAVSKKMLALDRDVVGQAGKLARDTLDDTHGMPDPVEEIRVAKGHVLNPLLHLRSDIVENDPNRDHPELSIVDRYDRTVPTPVLTPRLASVYPTTRRSDPCCNVA